MKKLLLVCLGLSLIGCSENETSPVASPEENKVLLLKVDATTAAFEGGKELVFEDAESFTIAHEYDVPDDFGGIKLMYSELNAPLFEGTIHWAGLGSMSYPQIDAPSSFLSSETTVALPGENLREVVDYANGAVPHEWPYAPEYDNLWAAVSNLNVVKEYRAVNPDSKVYFFLYTPSVGVGNPIEWDWFIILKN